MTDINKQIEEIGKEGKSSLRDYCHALTLPYILCDTKLRHNSAKELAGKSYLLGYKDALHSSRWRKVSEELPEDNESLLDNDIPNVECTRYVFAKTKDGHIYENRRLKMAIGNKEWVWEMSVEGDTNFVEWKPID